MHSSDRFRALLFLTVTLVQLPMVLWLIVTTKSVWPLLFAVVVSVPYLSELKSPWHSPDRPLAAFAALAWWVCSAVFGVLLPFAWIASSGFAFRQAHLVAFAIAGVTGVLSVNQRPRLVKKTVRIANLPAELDGYRIGHLTDVHCGPHAPKERVEQWARRLSRLDLDLITVTGDLITSGSRYVEPVAEALGTLRAKDGVYACMGNHDYFTNGELIVRELEQRGLSVLRNDGVFLAERKLFVAGVDDTWSRRDDMPRALRDRPDGVPALLLAHDPELFEQATAHDVTLMLSGHTHGGQLALPLSRKWSLARVTTKLTSGMFQRGTSWLYVSRGAGTTGPPVRLWAPAELTVLTLKAG